MTGMIKITSKNIIAALLVFASMAWFTGISFIAAHTEFYRSIVDSLPTLYVRSDQFENILSVLVLTVLFSPSGFILAYPYIKANFNSYILVRSFLLALGVGLSLYVPFALYNFDVNFGK